jgi:hypothetical protein
MKISKMVVFVGLGVLACVLANQGEAETPAQAAAKAARAKAKLDAAKEALERSKDGQY